MVAFMQKVQSSAMGPQQDSPWLCLSVQGLDARRYYICVGAGGLLELLFFNYFFSFSSFSSIAFSKRFRMAIPSAFTFPR